MPTYEYACKSCGERLEVQQRFTDDPLTECPSCEGPLRKVFGNVGIAFKGSGFYKNDSRGGSKSSSTPKADTPAGTATSDAGSSSGASSGGGSSSGESSSGGSSSTAPASTTAAAS